LGFSLAEGWPTPDASGFDLHGPTICSYAVDAGM
jgi:hypothetical protein